MKKSIASIFLPLLLVTFVAADVAPDPGYKRVSIKLKLQPADDFPGHRFFLRSGTMLEEVKLSKGQPVVLSPLGGGAFYSSGVLLAVPTTSLQGLSDEKTTDRLSDLKRSIFEGKAAGIIELVRHGFSRELPESEAGTVSDAEYRIEADPSVGVKAVFVSGGLPSGIVGSNAPQQGRSWGTLAAVIVPAIFLAFGFLILGIWYFSRSTRKV